MLTEFSKDCNTPPIPFLFCFRSPEFLWKYVNEGLFVSTEANIATCSHRWLPLLNSTTILETPIWKHSNSACPHWAFISDFQAGSAAWCLYTEVRFCWKTKLGLLPFCRRITKSGHSGVMTGILVLEFRNLDSHSALSRPYYFERIFPESCLLGEKVQFWPSDSFRLYYSIIA